MIQLRQEIIFFEKGADGTLVPAPVENERISAQATRSSAAKASRQMEGDTDIRMSAPGHSADSEMQIDQVGEAQSGFTGGVLYKTMQDWVEKGV